MKIIKRKLYSQNHKYLLISLLLKLLQNISIKLEFYIEFKNSTYTTHIHLIKFFQTQFLIKPHQTNNFYYRINKTFVNNYINYPYTLLIFIFHIPLSLITVKINNKWLDLDLYIYYITLITYNTILSKIT